jgi:hypothetical protein
MFAGGIGVKVGEGIGDVCAWATPISPTIATTPDTRINTTTVVPARLR